MKKQSSMNMKHCEVCNDQYEAGRSRCPGCGTLNKLFESASFVRVEIEMERALYNAIEEFRRTNVYNGTAEQFIIEAVEQRISRRKS